MFRGFAVTRRVYRDTGGFESRYGLFADRALAATLHARGYRTGWADRAIVVHRNVGRYRELRDSIADYVAGELAYRQTHDPGYCSRYFGEPPGWVEWRDWAPGGVRPGLRAVAASLAGGAALALSREAVPLLGGAVLGRARARVRAQAGVAWAGLRYLVIPGEGARRYRRVPRSVATGPPAWWRRHTRTGGPPPRCGRRSRPETCPSPISTATAPSAFTRSSGGATVPSGGPPGWPSSGSRSRRAAIASRSTPSRSALRAPCRCAGTADGSARWSAGTARSRSRCRCGPTRAPPAARPPGRARAPAGSAAGRAAPARPAVLRAADATGLSFFTSIISPLPRELA